jgi:hypothetical protein
VGVQEDTKEIICGLVDTFGTTPSHPSRLFSDPPLSLGSYTIAKTLEYKAKQNLSSGKETTIMPPAEYQERFVNALEGYFVACPGMILPSIIDPALKFSPQTNGRSLKTRNFLLKVSIRYQTFSEHDGSNACYLFT